MPRLRRTNCNGPGLRRRRAGRGFYYVDEQGRRVVDPAVIDRIRTLAIPPAWQDVWICPVANGHIQAVGTDSRGRRQYRYHDAWRRQRDREKFDHMLEFAAALPDLRQRCRVLMAQPDLSRDRVLACATRLLDLGFFRIGTEGYADENQTYGLATMRKTHVKLRAEGVIEFDYVAKGSQQRAQSVVDPEVYAVVETLKRRTSGGPELLAYRSGSGWVDVRSSDINAFLKENTGKEISAKDFRTWSATVLMAVALAVSEGVSSESSRKRAVTRAFKEVAGYLGNTPAVCRGSYVDPRIVDRYYAGETVKHVLARLGEADGLASQGAVETAVVDLLSDAPPAMNAA